MVSPVETKHCLCHLEKNAYNLNVLRFFDTGKSNKVGQIRFVVMIIT